MWCGEWSVGEEVQPRVESRRRSCNRCDNTLVSWFKCLHHIPRWCQVAFSVWDIAVTLFHLFGMLHKHCSRTSLFAQTFYASPSWLMLLFGYSKYEIWSHLFPISVMQNLLTSFFLQKCSSNFEWMLLFCCSQWHATTKISPLSMCFFFNKSQGLICKSLGFLW